MSAPITERRQLPISPVDAARLFILDDWDTVDIAQAMGIKEAHAARLLRTGLQLPRAAVFRNIKSRREA